MNRSLPCIDRLSKIRRENRLSTGGGQTKPIELLAALGINDDISRKKIYRPTSKD